VLSIPSALEVLKSRVGDCNEHTVLFAALARSVDIPTRIALGVVWSEELDGFYYHAWPEVFVGEWLWMDPTLGQTVADATHVKLLTGDIERWPRLLPFLGKLRIEVTEVD
ncbi:MAG TPA: transglutaminase-like domain-containing protein, partial [Candidatus Hydrogenedentes bacterium]|nr:transglutaminase-like domain-containing protein [Candidatus Hydrogenedentota bacterium]